MFGGSFVYVVNHGSVMCCELVWLAQWWTSNELLLLNGSVRLDPSKLFLSNRQRSPRSKHKRSWPSVFTRTRRWRVSSHRRNRWSWRRAWPRSPSAVAFVAVALAMSWWVSRIRRRGNTRTEEGAGEWWQIRKWCHKDNSVQSSSWWQWVCLYCICVFPIQCSESAKMCFTAIYCWQLHKFWSRFPWCTAHWASCPGRRWGAGAIFEFPVCSLLGSEVRWDNNQNSQIAGGCSVWSIKLWGFTTSTCATCSPSRDSCHRAARVGSHLRLRVQALVSIWRGMSFCSGLVWWDGSG